MTAHDAALPPDLTTAVYARRLVRWQRDGHWITSDFRPPHSSSLFMTTATAVRAIRSEKGMLITLDDPDCRSAGSFFKNPILSEAQYCDLCQRAEAMSLHVPRYPALEQQHKISAAWLVEHSGFAKGYTLGEAAISKKHALAIVNRGNASAADVVALKEQIQEKVLKDWNVELQPEPVFVGFTPEA